MGCGPGGLLALLRSHAKNCNTIGIDISPEQILKAKQISLSADFIHAIAENLPFRNSTIDIAFMIEVFEHLMRPETALMELKRVLKPGGKLIMSFPNCFAYFPFYLLPIPESPKLAGYLYKLGLFPYEHPLVTMQPIDHMYALSHVVKMLKKGFKVIHCESDVPFPPLWHFSKGHKILRKCLIPIRYLLLKINKFFFSYRIFLYITRK